MAIDTPRRISAHDRRPGVSIGYSVVQRTAWGESPLVSAVQPIREMRLMHVALVPAQPGDQRVPSLDEVETRFFARQLEVIQSEAWSRLRLDAYHEGRCPDLGESSPGRLARRAPT